MANIICAVSSKEPYLKKESPVISKKKREKKPYNWWLRCAEPTKKPYTKKKALQLEKGAL